VSVPVRLGTGARTRADIARAHDEVREVARVERALHDVEAVGRTQAPASAATPSHIVTFSFANSVVREIAGQNPATGFDTASPISGVHVKARGLSVVSP
jgi:hypothetical protein